MKKLNITRKHFNESKYFQEKYGKLQFVSESGKLFKTDKGRILKFKESHQKGEHLYSVIVKKPGGWDGSFQVNAMNGDEALEKAKSRLGRGSRILRIEDIGEYKAFDADDYAGFDESSDGGWFDTRGDLLKPLPGDCIMACAGQGRVDDDVAFWVDELGFDIDLPRDKAIKFLSEYGAWEPDELENMDIIELAEKVLWIFCNDLKEQAYDMVGEDEELAAKLGDDPSAWGDEEWKQFQNEYGICTLNN